MNIKKLKEYIKDLPDDMDVKLNIDFVEYIPSLETQDNKLIIS